MIIEFRYDTQLLIEGEELDTVELINHITTTFKGDSLICVGDDELVKIHFHTNEPWDVLKYCAQKGEIHDIVIEDMIRQSKGLQG